MTHRTENDRKGCLLIWRSCSCRSFIKNNHAELKMLNPTTPFLIRDGWPGKDPYIVATYGNVMMCRQSSCSYGQQGWRKGRGGG